MFVLQTVPHGYCATKITRTCDLRALSCSNILTRILNKRHIHHATVHMNISRLDVDLNRLKPKFIKQTKKNSYNLPLNYQRTKLYSQYNTLSPITPSPITPSPNTESPNTESPNNTLLTTNIKNSNTPTNGSKKLSRTRIKTNHESTNQSSNQSSNEYKNKLAIKLWQLFNNKIINIIKTEKAKHHKILLLDMHSFPKGSFNGAQIAIIDIYKTNRVKLDKFTIHIIEKMHIDIKIFNGLDNHIQNTYKKSTYPILIEFCEDRTYLLNDTIKLFFQELLNYFIL